MRQRAAAHLGRVSVVRMARVNAAKELAELRGAAASSGSARRIFSTRSGTPMTPVEHTKISSARQPIARAACAAVRGEAGRPSGPVEQFALPEFTTTPRIVPWEARKCSRESASGAACTRLVVKTAAAEAGEPLEIMPRLSFPLFLRPQDSAEKQYPRGTADCGREFLMRSVRPAPEATRGRARTEPSQRPALTFLASGSPHSRPRPSPSPPA